MLRRFAAVWTPEAVALSLGLALSSNVAYAAAGLDGLVGKIEQFNTALIAVGGVLSVTGFIWAMAALTIGLGGLVRAVSCLLGGLAIANAGQIVGFFVH